MISLEYHWILTSHAGKTLPSLTLPDLGVRGHGICLTNSWPYRNDINLIPFLKTRLAGNLHLPESIYRMLNPWVTCLLDKNVQVTREKYEKVNGSNGSGETDFQFP